MRFWDSSALVPLLVSEPSSVDVAREYGSDPEVVTWWATGVECASAVCRLEREGKLPAAGVTDALRRLEELSGSWHTIQPVVRIRSIALRLMRAHPLRAADALQLAAAHLAAEDHPATLPILTFDDRLALAAEREGFPVIQLDRAR